MRLRFIYICIFVAILAINLTGCNGALTQSKVNSENPVNSTSNTVSATSSSTETTTKTSTETSIETSISDSLTLDSNESNIQEEVTIIVSYEKPLSIENKNTIFLDGLLEGAEYIEVIVKGEVFDFEQIALIWDESNNELKEKETVKKIEKLENQTLVIATYQPDGIPTEKIKWKSRTGKTYEYIIQENSIGDTDSNISKFEIN